MVSTRLGISDDFSDRPGVIRTLCPRKVALGSTPPRTYGDKVCPPRADHPAVIRASLKLPHSYNAFSKVHSCEGHQHERSDLFCPILSYLLPEAS